MRQLIAGNWKMNGTVQTALAFVDHLTRGLSAPPSADLLLCPSFLHLGLLYRLLKEADLPVLLGAQDCSAQDIGAYTGDCAAAQLKNLHASHVILGHSERRQHHQETDATVRAKAQAALRAGLTPIICVGESEAQRGAGQTEQVVRTQLSGSIPAGAGQNIVIAYEPIWAIGTGKTPTLKEIEAVHGLIRKALEEGAKIRILYGGSVKPENAPEILAVPGVDGALVGGASLQAESFLSIVDAAKV